MNALLHKMLVEVLGGLHVEFLALRLEHQMAKMQIAAKDAEIADLKAKLKAAADALDAANALDAAKPAEAPAATEGIAKPAEAA